MRRGVLILALLASCAGWRMQPAVGVTSRDEQIGSIGYRGETLFASMTWVPVETPVAERITLPPLEPDPPEDAPPLKGYDREIEAAGGWPWYAWGGIVCLVLALCLWLWIWKLQPSETPEK